MDFDLGPTLDEQYAEFSQATKEQAILETSENYFETACLDVFATLSSPLILPIRSSAAQSAL